MLLLLTLACADGAKDTVGDSVADTSDTAPPPDADGDGSPDGEDCGPTDPYTYPGAEEWCDLVDHDCDGEPLPPGVCGKPQLVEALDGASRITAPDHLDYASTVHFLDDMDGEPGQELAIETAFPTEWDPASGHYALAIVPSPLPSRDTTLTEAAATVLVSQGEDVRHWIPAGDFDGDGWNDLVMASYGYFYPATTYLVRGPVSRYPGTLLIHEVASASWGELAPMEGFGAQANAGGDANGDGLTDILVSASYSEEAMTVLLYGRADGLALGMDTSLETVNTGHGREGVQFTGDQDGDGIDDLRLMMSQLDWVSGADITPYAHEDWMSFARRFVVNDGVGCGRLSAFGAAPPRLGDWDGDGIEDMLVDCTEDAWSPNGRDTSYLFVSGAAIVAAESGTSIHDIATGSWDMHPSWGGYIREDAGDVDGDGATDLLVSASNEHDQDGIPPNTTDAMTVVLLSSDGPPAPWTDPSERGYALRSDVYAPDGTFLIGAAGDFDGDGLGDLAVTARTWESSVPSEVWLVPNWGIPWSDASLF